MFCLMVLYWEQRWREGRRGFVGWLRAGLIFGGIAVALLHAPELVSKVAGRPLPPDKDPLRRVRAWQATADLVNAARTRLLAEGKPVFLIAHHYGITGLLSFYLPEARPQPGALPLVYSVLGPVPDNQFYFWPEYRYRRFRQGRTPSLSWSWIRRATPLARGSNLWSQAGWKCYPMLRCPSGFRSRCCGNSTR